MAYKPQGRFDPITRTYVLNNSDEAIRPHNNDTAEDLLKKIVVWSEKIRDGGGGGGGGAAATDFPLPLTTYVDGAGDFACYGAVIRDTGSNTSTTFFLNDNLGIIAKPPGAVPLVASGGGGAAGDEFEIISFPKPFGSTAESNPPTTGLARKFIVRNITQGTDEERWYNLQGDLIPAGFPVPGTAMEIADASFTPLDWEPVVTRMRASQDDTGTTPSVFSAGDIIWRIDWYELPYNNTPTDTRYYYPATASYLPSVVPADLEDIDGVVELPDLGTTTTTQNIPRGAKSVNITNQGTADVTVTIEGVGARTIEPGRTFPANATAGSVLPAFDITAGGETVYWTVIR